MKAIVTTIDNNGHPAPVITTVDGRVLVATTPEEEQVAARQGELRELTTITVTEWLAEGGCTVEQVLAMTPAERTGDGRAVLQAPDKIVSGTP